MTGLTAGTLATELAELALDEAEETTAAEEDETTTAAEEEEEETAAAEEADLVMVGAPVGAWI